MTSNSIPREAYVWIWLPGFVRPVVAGKVEVENGVMSFNYGRSYLENADAISIYDPELPLQGGRTEPLKGLSIPSCLRDAAPDAWGRRVILNRLTGAKGADADNAQLDELTYMLESGSDRIGALDFQASPRDYVPRASEGATLDQLLDSVDRVEKGIPLAPELDQALFHGSSIGGARPKALIEDADKKYVAKFSTSSDLYNVVKAEYIAMRLADLCGLNVAAVKLTRAAGKDVILIERFDRIKSAVGWHRKSMVSALTMFELDELMARYASYEILAEIIRKRFTDPKSTLKELFGRLIFNILSGNTDDHARNHAAFWDGSMLTLTPAYDICPQGRSGREATQAMLIHENNRLSQLQLCINAAATFHLSTDEAKEIVSAQIDVINQNWNAICDEAELSQVDRQFFWQRQFMNPFAFEGSGFLV